jgi:hypothetical protein
MFRSGVLECPECLIIVHSDDKYCGRTLCYGSGTDIENKGKNILKSV